MKGILRPRSVDIRRVCDGSNRTLHRNESDGQLAARNTAAVRRRCTELLLAGTVAGILFGQTPAHGAPAPPLAGAGQVMTQTHKRAKPEVPDTQQLETGDFNDAQGPGPGPIGPGPGCNVFPASAAIGTKIGLSYFGPPPSTDNPSLVGPEQLLKSGTIDATKGTITLPLYLGYMAGTHQKVWYILTDVDDQGVAAELGLNYSAKLTYAANGARTANFDNNNDLIIEKGTVDFRPVRKIVPGPSGAEFPPVSAQPGAIGDRNYSPLVRVLNDGGTIYNAPIVAFGLEANQISFPNGNVDYTKVHDQVIAINPVAMTVTLNLVNGFSFGRPVWYVSMDASIPLAAAIEHNTYAPLQAKLPLGNDDSFSSPIERIFIATNGAERDACDNPKRQGLSADLADGHRPNNTLGGIPTIALDYSPMWDANLYEWTADAISKGYRQQLREEFQILTYVQDGLLTGPAGKPFGSAGFSINCPVVIRLD